MDDMKNQIKLNPGEVLCNECNGTGDHGYTKPSENIHSWLIVCRKCHGTGKLDWIENIVGKPSPPDFQLYGDDIVKELAKDLAAEIDKDMLKLIVKTVNYKSK
jgi:hypothetical protein